MTRRGVFDLILNKDEYMQPEQVAVPVKMADSTTQDPDELVECPYDKIHRIRVSRFPMHLLKCRKNYTGREMFTCPFNARHLVPKPEARHHVANCVDKAAIEKEMVDGFDSSNSYCKGYVKVPSYSTNNEGPPATENWDEEINQANDQEREYFGGGDDTGDESSGSHLPRPKGRGTPRAVGHIQQPQMRLPRQPAQAAAVAQQRHHKILEQQQQSQPLPPQLNNLPQQPLAPTQIKVAGLGRGQFKGRVMAANLWGGGNQPQAPGQQANSGQASPNAVPSPPRPGGLTNSSWAQQQPSQNGPTNLSSLDDFPALGAAPQPQRAPMGLGRGLGRGNLLAPPNGSKF